MVVWLMRCSAKISFERVFTNIPLMAIASRSQTSTIAKDNMSYAWIPTIFVKGGIGNPESRPQYRQ